MEYQNKNRDTTIQLLFNSFIIAMLVFAALRVCGFTYFVQQYVDIRLSPITSRLIMFAYFVVEGTLILKTLTDLKTSRCVAWAVGYKLLQYLINPQLVLVGVLLDIAFATIVPLIFNRDKKASIKQSLFFIAAICAYQSLMMFGRYGNAIVGKQNVFWGIISTLDYKFFLASIFTGKELLQMDNHCFFFWGKFDGLAKRIGRAIIKPFFRD